LKRLLITLALVLIAAAIATLLAATAPARSTATIVNVSGREFLFALSRKSALHGTFIFKFKNIGNLPHDFKIAGRKTPLLQPGRSATLTVRIAKPGRYRYLCTVPGHAAAGMRGIFIVR
jgi:plastocyanin